MQERIIETVIFWVLFGALTSWVLGNFYLNYRKEAARYLRRIGIGINAFVFLLFFTAWLAPEKGSLSGFDLLRLGRIDVALYAITLLVATLTVLLTRHTTMLKIGAGFQAAASILIFVVMIRVNPIITSITFADVIPIVSVFLLLANNIMTFMYVQQLQLKQREGK